ncbi:methyl-accepting chemotaxis protein [Corallincola holothuriorum]|uniref:Methyl-accepting chemotaxis protein n=1 Tax=Corallincola holothuriorum TaxID=2282215 RepID=A0A368N6U6_9GAMM|nr:methyl-accepting chemotaxis protein [Corallincola holothuriorum]RCU45301.1 methyl-accepting chemotaxis protein [Corallincola holothuriorum]
MKNFSIASKIYLTISAVGVVLLIITLAFSYHHESDLVAELAEQQVLATSDAYFESINTLMLAGAMDKRHILKDKMITQPNIRELRLMRGVSVSQLYGIGIPDQQPQDELDQAALAGSNVNLRHVLNDELVQTLITPIVMKKNHDGINCLSCHVTSKEGDIAGAVRISYSLEQAHNKIVQAMWHQGGLLTLVFIAGSLMLILVFRSFVAKPLASLSQRLRSACSNADLSENFATDKTDEVGELSNAIDTLVTHFKSNLHQLIANSHRLNETAAQVASLAESTETSVIELKTGTDSVATSMTQMEASAREVKQNAEYTAERSASASQQARSGSEDASRVTQDIHALVTSVDKASNSLSELDARSQKVATVVDVISAIAEQTNLLALNAAIEAARAGEQGRGFAVVADEVRSLANRTHESTVEIKQIIDELRQQSQVAVSTMHSANDAAERSANAVDQLATLLETISGHSQEITDLNAQMATASHEQSTAVEETNRHISAIREIAETSAQQVHEDEEISEKMLALAQQMEQSVNKYKI